MVLEPLTRKPGAGLGLLQAHREPGLGYIGPLGTMEP